MTTTKTRAEAEARLTHAQERLTYYCEVEPNTVLALAAGYEWNNAFKELETL